MTNQPDKPSVEGLSELVFAFGRAQVACNGKGSDEGAEAYKAVIQYARRLASQSAAEELPPAPVAPEGHEWREDVKAFVRHNANGTDSVYNPLPDIARELNVMLGSAIQHGDGDWITGYTIKTWALHRILGAMQAAGHSVVIPNGLAKEPASAAPPIADKLRSEGRDWCEEQGHERPGEGADAYVEGYRRARAAPPIAVLLEVLEAMKGSERALDAYGLEARSFTRLGNAAAIAKLRTWMGADHG